MKIEDFWNITLVVDLCLILTSKIMGGWIQWHDVQTVFKSQVSWMKTDNFRNLDDVDFLMFRPQNNWWLNSLIWYANPVEISSQLDENWGFQKLHLTFWSLAYVDLFAYVDLIKNWCLNSMNWYANSLQISTRSDENWWF